MQGKIFFPPQLRQLTTDANSLFDGLLVDSLELQRGLLHAVVLGGRRHRNADDVSHLSHPSTWQANVKKMKTLPKHRNRRQKFCLLSLQTGCSAAAGKTARRRLSRKEGFSSTKPLRLCTDNNIHRQHNFDEKSLHTDQNI